MKIRARQMRVVRHVMRRGMVEELSLTGRIPGCRARGRKTKGEVYGWNNKNSRR